MIYSNWRRFFFVFTIFVYIFHNLNAFDAVEFEPFRPSDSYKCGQFIETTINDPAMRLFYRLNNQFIRLLSRPFPHEQLLSRSALQGNITEIEKSFQNKYMLWVDFEKYWLTVCATLVVLTVIFTVFYLFYRCFLVCCCRRNVKKPIERRYDNCQRVFLDILISFAVIVNLFAAVILLISTQYTYFGVEELPTRLHYCANDLNVYKFENNERIRKLFREDFQTLNGTLVKNFNAIGADIVKKFKRLIGANSIDELLTQVKRAESIRKKFVNAEVLLRDTQKNKQLLTKELFKLRDVEASLQKCAVDVDVASASPSQTPQSAGSVKNVTVKMCQTVLQLIRPLMNNEEVVGDKIFDEFTIQSMFLHQNTYYSLQKISDLKLDQKLLQVTGLLNSLEPNIQKVVNLRQNDFTLRLLDLDETMFRIYENISSRIRSFDVKIVEDLVDPMMQNREQFKIYVEYSWFITLITTGIFMFIAFAFLLGLFYGCCGRKPSLYNDDCCVRTTGNRFYSCGIWLCMTFLVFFAVITSVLIFVGANATQFLCHSTENLLTKADMLSFFNRLIEANGLEDHNQLSIYRLPQVFNSKRHLADIVRGCQNGETFYTMFGLDRKFKLLDGGGPIDEYNELVSTVKLLVIGRNFHAHNEQFYNDDLVDALDRLGKVDIKLYDRIAIEKFRSMASHYDVDSVVHQLKKILTSENVFESSLSANIKRFIISLTDLKLDAQNVLAKINNVAAEFENLRLELDTIAELVNSTLIAELTSKLQHINTTLNSPDANEKLDLAAGEAADELGSIIKQYANHVNNSMRTEISSCEPIRKLLLSTRAAICDYTLDPFNGVWMAMAISLLLLSPIIILSTRLMGLYSRTDPLHTYLQECTENNFATDIYYGNDDLAARILKPSNAYHSENNFLNGYSNSLYNNNNNYNYQDYYALGYRNGRS